MSREPRDVIREAMREHRVVALAGGPNTGKTTVASQILEANPDTVLIHGDDYLELGWSASSQALRDAANAETGNLLIEGVQVPRAIRKGMDVGCLIVLTKVHEYNTKRQAALAKGMHTVITELSQNKALMKTMEIITLD